CLCLRRRPLRDHLLSLLSLRPPPTSPLFPYTTLFRSPLGGVLICRSLCRLADAAAASHQLLQHRVGLLQSGHRDGDGWQAHSVRSEEHTSELQSLTNLVCRLLLEKKNTNL